jgi:hypothetical protein
VIEFIGGGAEARGGSIGSMKIFCELLGFVDKPTATKLLKAYEDGEKKYFEEMKPIEKMRDSMNKANPKLFDHKRGEISAVNIINKVMPIIKDWFSRTDKYQRMKLMISLESCLNMSHREQKTLEGL